MADPVSSLDAPFTRRSKTESICMYCFITVRVNLGDSLDFAEVLHADECLVMTDDVRKSVKQR